MYFCHLLKNHSYSYYILCILIGKITVDNNLKCTANIFFLLNYILNIMHPNLFSLLAI